SLNRPALKTSSDSTWLKVLSLEVFSAGLFSDEERGLVHRTLVYRDREKGIYRALMVRTGRVVGTVSVGPWPERQQVLNRIRDGKRLWPWQVGRFVLTGNPGDSNDQSVGQWPTATVVCQCRGLTRGQLQEYLDRGVTAVTDLKQASGAATVCGGCEPLLDSLCGGQGAAKRSVPGGRSLAIIAALSAVFLGVALWLPPPMPATSVLEMGFFELVSRNPLWRQWSGYAVLIASLLLLLMSLKKRFPGLPMGGFSGWRIAHAALGAMALALLYGHTGFSLGDNLNRWLMLSFLGVGIVGMTAALLTRLQGSVPAMGRLRQGSTWLHILVCWPLPALLVFHILSAYYF
ncbi:(2Fe-2S)-binding protein, partial [Alcanivorax sp. HI0003]|uniref:(2Fe-2S)-binding protein n=1 Tax=Alcanivorax sp. HI0003 TaxID=1822217 RepID=UPI000AF6D542